MFVGVLATAPPSPVVFLRSSGFDSEPHPAPRMQWVVMVRGAIEIEVSDGSRRTFRPGDLLLLEDVTGRGHTTYTVGDPPFEGLFGLLNARQPRACRGYGSGVPVPGWARPHS